MLRATTNSCFTVLLTLIAISIPSKVFAEPARATVQPALTVATDEHQIEKEREQALQDALATVDPELKKESESKKTGKVSGMDPKTIQIQVEKLRAERKNQFKYLTRTHINEMINSDSVLAKARFLDEREKTLGSVIERAAQVHVPAQVARERMGLAKWRIGKSIRDFLPEATFTGDVKHGSLSGETYVSNGWRMAMRQPIFRGGVLWNTLMMEWTNLEVARREYDKTVSDLIADVSQSYFEFERARNLQNDQAKLFESVKEQKRISDEKYKENLISEIEKLNVDSLYSQTQYDLETAQQELEIARLELQRFLKLDPKDPLDVQALYHLDGLKLDALKEAGKKVLGSNHPREFEANLNQFIDLSYQNRPDLKVEASKLKASQLAYRIAMGRKLPQIDLILEVGELAEAYEVFTRNPDHKIEFRSGMEVSWPLAGNSLKYTYDNNQQAPSVTQYLGGQGSRTVANSFSVGILDDLGQFTTMKETKINSLEQVVELEKTERDVVREVKEAYFNFNKAIIQVESAFKRMGYREKLSGVSKHRLEQNEIQISEYLQTQMDYVEERGLVYKALTDFFLSKAKLNRAIGMKDYLSVEALE